ncbi:MAG: Omp28-related outer membrane protein [Flavobacteriales bacterium]|nr:Omp28-related outer membrane protein [Flavobacteriales bacterium]
MKKIFLTTFTIISFLIINAQNYTISSYIGDDGDYWSGGYVYNFLYPTSSLSSWYDLPFDWTFYGQAVNGYRIAHDGYITFDNSSGNSIGNNTNLPNASGPNNAIYALWDEFTDDVTISVKTYGAKPNRVHVITWAGLNYSGAASWSDDINVSINIYENCGDFEVVVSKRDIDPTSSFYPMINTSIGCENINGTISAELSGSPNYIPSNPGYQKELYEVHRFSWNNPIINDASLITVRTENHLTVGNHSLLGTVRNEGDALLSSYDINYTLNGGAVQSTTISTYPDTIKNSNISEWIHATDINISSSSDNYELKLWVSNVNGQSDERSCNDTLVEYITGIANISADKKVLVEKNTGTWCGYCSDGAAVLDDLVVQHGDDTIPVVIHDGDQMEFLDSLRSSFSIFSYPGALIDRTKPSSSGIYEGESYERGSWESRVSDQLTKFTPVNITINGTWDVISREVVANVNLGYTDNSAGDTRIVLMIVEDSLSGIGSGWDQANNYDNSAGHPYYGAGGSIVGFIHKHVLRDYAEGGCFGVDNVIPHFVSAGSNYQHTFNYTLPTDFDANQIALVAAVVKYSEGNDAAYVGIRGQKTVYNAKSIQLTDFSLPSGIDDILPNNKQLIKIVDFLGRECGKSKNQPLLYIYDDGTVEKKIILE